MPLASPRILRLRVSGRIYGLYKVLLKQLPKVCLEGTQQWVKVSLQSVTSVSSRLYIGDSRMFCIDQGLLCRSWSTLRCFELASTQPRTQDGQAQLAGSTNSQRLKPTTPCLKENCANLFFCQNFDKFRPIVKIFGTKVANRTSFSEVYSFSTSPNLCQRTTVLKADVPNWVYLRKACSLCYHCAKNFHNWSKFDKVLAKNKFAQFSLRHGVVGLRRWLLVEPASWVWSSCVLGCVYMCDSRSVSQQSWQQGLLLGRTHCFFPSDGRNHHQ